MPHSREVALGQHPVDADVIIIGGGPAGSTLACLLANGRHRAIVVERAIHPREHVGELLAPSVNAILHRIGLLPRMDAEGYIRRTGIGWTAPRATESQSLILPVAQYPPPRALRRYGFNVERDHFDALLVRHALACGAQVLEGVNARRIVFRDGRATGVQIQEPDGRLRELTGHFIVDASGRRSLLASQLGLLQREQPRRCALYARFRDVDPGRLGDGTYAFVHMLDQNRAWGWQIPLRNGLCSIGVVAGCESLRGVSGDGDACFESMIKNNRVLKRGLERAQRVGPWHAVGDYSYQVRRQHGKGWLLIGDAAGFIDPIFASGVDIAMYSAVFAYESILPLLLLGQWSAADEQFALSSYERRLQLGTHVWAYAVGLFYGSPHKLRSLAQDQSLIPAVCRFLQGNPYEEQNQLIDQKLVDRMGFHDQLDELPGC